MIVKSNHLKRPWSRMLTIKYERLIRESVTYHFRQVGLFQVTFERSVFALFVAAVEPSSLKSLCMRLVEFKVPSEFAGILSKGFSGAADLWLHGLSAQQHFCLGTMLKQENPTQCKAYKTCKIHSCWNRAESCNQEAQDLQWGCWKIGWVFSIWGVRGQIPPWSLCTVEHECHWPLISVQKLKEYRKSTWFSWFWIA